MTDLMTVSEAKEIVGCAMFGDDWVAEITKNEWDLAQQYKKGLTRDPAAEEAHAKWKRADRQGSKVGEWLEDRGFNTTKEYLNRPRLDAVFAKAFGRPLTNDAMPLRDKFILERLLSGQRPGKNITWPVFRTSIKKALGDSAAEGTSVKQLRRVVERLMKAHQLN
jgi:hypothetical protein